MPIDFEVTMNEYLPLRDVVFNTLRRAILRGELKPGERLMEIQLANKLGVSRTPIREAIRKLELEGLVLMIPRKGAEVAEITEKNLRDVLEVRGALEELAEDHSLFVTIEENVLTGGYGSQILDYVSRAKLNVKVRNIGISDDYVEHGNVEVLRHEVGLDRDDIVKQVLADYLTMRDE